MSQSGIYQIQSKIKPERIYIGSSFKIHTRWFAHLRYLKNRNHHSPKLQNHYNKYGESDLVFSIIEPCLPDWATIREQYYIDKLKPYFNICQSAFSRRGVKQSAEAIAKRVAKTKGRIPPQSERDNISKALKGRIFSEEHRQHIREARLRDRQFPPSRLGIKHTKETKLKMSRNRICWNKGIPCTEEAKRNQSIKMKGKLAGEKNPNFGKHLSVEDKIKMSIAVKAGLLRKKEKELINLKIA